MFFFELSGILLGFKLVGIEVKCLGLFMVVVIIILVFGILGIFVGCCGMVGVFLMEMFVNFMLEMVEEVGLLGVEGDV